MYFHLVWDSESNDKNVILKTRLPTPLYNAGNYEMAIIEASISNKFNNVPENRSIRFIKDNEGLDSSQELTEQNYTDAASIVSVLKSLIKKSNFDKSVTLLKAGETIQWTLHPGVEIVMSQELKSILGLNNYVKMKAGQTEKKFKGLCDLQRNFHRIFLTSNDIIPSTYIQDTMLKIMSSFPVNYDVTNSTAFYYAPIYFKLNLNHLETVQILMLNEQMRQMTSSEGCAYCLVHIRPCGSS